MKTIVKGLLASAGLALILGGLLYGALNALDACSGWLERQSAVTDTLEASVFCIVVVVHLVTLEIFFGGLPRPWECTWREIGLGLLLGGTALLFAAGGPLFTTVPEQGLMQALAQVVGVIYAALVGVTVLTLFLALACWNIVEAVTENFSELVDTLRFGP